ncbi:MAG: hypothetical protein KDD46_02795 [Bdellovibrionales bacterium]|nr:hypothetical protein [Bdellovibrionales bacterium]
MKHLYFFGIWLLFAQSSLASIPQSDEKIDLDIQNSWRLFIQTEVHSQEHGLGILSSLYEYQLENKIDALPAISSLLLSKVVAQKATSNMKDHPYWLYATRFDPYSPNPYYQICQYGNKTPIVERAGDCIKGLKKEFALKEGRMFQYAYFSHILYSTILLTIAVMVLFFLIKYMPFIFQFISSRFVWLSPMACGVFLILLWSALSLSFGWVFGITFLGWGLWYFMDRFERYVMLILFGLSALIPYTFEAPARYFQFQEEVQNNIHVSMSADDLLYQSNRAYQSGDSFEHFNQSMYPRTFYRSDKIQLFLTLLFGVLVMFILGLFNQIGDYFFIFQKRENYAKRMIIRDLQNFPKLYFNYLKKLQRLDIIRRILYYTFPSFYFFDRERPVTAIIVSFTLAFLFFGWFHAVRFFEMYHFLWTYTWGGLLCVALIIFWALPKIDKNRELYEKKS